MDEKPKRRYSPRRPKVAPPIDDTLVRIEHELTMPKPPTAKKGLDPFTKSIADMAGMQVKKFIDTRVNIPEKSISAKESSSIAQAATRLLDRHFGKTLRKFLPKGAKSDDFNDMKEILLSLSMWALRYAELTMKEATLNKQIAMDKAKRERENMTSQDVPFPLDRQQHTYRESLNKEATVGGNYLSHDIPDKVFLNNSLMSQLDSILVENGGANGVLE